MRKGNKKRGDRKRKRGTRVDEIMRVKRRGNKLTNKQEDRKQEERLHEETRGKERRGVKEAKRIKVEDKDKKRRATRC